MFLLQIDCFFDNYEEARKKLKYYNPYPPTSYLFAHLVSQPQELPQKQQQQQQNLKQRHLFGSHDLHGQSNNDNKRPRVSLPLSGAVAPKVSPLPGFPPEIAHAVLVLLAKLGTPTDISHAMQVQALA
jgi:hypothetical protein